MIDFLLNGSTWMDAYASPFHQLAWTVVGFYLLSDWAVRNRHDTLRREIKELRAQLTQLARQMAR